MKRLEVVAKVVDAFVATMFVADAFVTARFVPVADVKVSAVIDVVARAEVPVA